MANKRQQRLYGALLALVLPWLVLMVLYFFQWRTFTLTEFFTINYDTGKIWSYAKLSLLINVAPFVIANQIQKTEFARGVFLMTLIYAVPLFFYILIN